MNAVKKVQVKNISDNILNEACKKSVKKRKITRKTILEKQCYVTFCTGDGNRKNVTIRENVSNNNATFRCGPRLNSIRTLGDALGGKNSSNGSEKPKKPKKRKK